MLSVSDIKKEFEEKPFLKRTIKGLAENLRHSEESVLFVLEENKDVFEKTCGCKGEMYRAII